MIKCSVTNDEWREHNKARTKKFGLDCVRYTETFPRSAAAAVMTRQLVRSSTSVSSNYRSSCRGRSRAECIAKLGIVEEEADESMLWLEMCMDLGYGSQGEGTRLHTEANELVAMTVHSIKLLKKSNRSE